MGGFAKRRDTGYKGRVEERKVRRILLGKKI